MPDYLCCQINSQVWDAMSSTSFKSQQVWSYPERINMGSYSFHIHDPVWYDIEAVIIHLGGAHCGHYFTWRKVNHRWYEVSARPKCTLFEIEITNLDLKVVTLE